MTDLVGVLGEREHRVDEPGRLSRTGTEAVIDYEDSAVNLSGTYHPEPHQTGEQPVAVDGGDTLLWLLGTVYGFDDGSTYSRRDQTRHTSSEYFARLYDEYGDGTFEGLNGDFICVLYDRTAGEVALIPDRLGFWDTYYTVDEGTLLFTTNVQLLTRYPGFTPAFERDYVYEFLMTRRQWGLTTPLTGVRALRPGTVTTFDLDTHDISEKLYWRPEYRPAKKPYSAVVTEFAERYRQAVAERAAHPGERGVLLSGGSDSRLLLGALTEEEKERTTAFHINDWMNDEAQVAKKVATTAGVDFEFLQREDDYHARLLKTAPKRSNFAGCFAQAHAEGVIDEIRARVDVVLDTMLTDMAFKGFKLPMRTLPLGPLGSPWIPVTKSLQRPEPFVEERLREHPPYLRTPPTIDEVLSENIQRRGKTVVNHGVAFASPLELHMWGDLFPRRAQSQFFFHSLRGHLSHRNPVMDNRLWELRCSLPPKYLYRRNIVNSALSELDPALARIPHADTRLPLSYPFLAHYAAEKYHSLDKRIRPRETPEPYYTHGSWMDWGELLREQEFAEETLTDNEDVIRRLPFLDWEGTLETYRSHRDGTNHTFTLYNLLTFLEMPVTKTIARSE